jgi:flagellin
LTGGSTAATRGTTDGFTEQTTSNLTRSVDRYFGNPSTYWYTDYYYNSTTTRFTVGDIKGKQNFSVSVDGRTFNFDLTNRIAGASITTGAEGELGDIVSKLQAAIAGVSGASAYTVTRDDANRAFSITYSYAERIGSAGGVATITGGSTSDTRGTTLGYVGSQTSVGSPATAAATPVNTSVFSGSARLNDTRISIHASATEAIGRIDAAMAAVDREQTTMGSVMNRLTYAGDNAGQISRNTTSSRSRLSDADYAAATTEVVRQQIILQASMAMLAQASQVPNSVINLLK